MFRNDDFARLKDRLSIDAIQIDRELIEFPSTLMEVTEACAEVSINRDRREHEYKVAVSLAQANLRDTPMHGKKMPETAIMQEALLDANVQAAASVLEDAKGSVLFWNGLLTAMMAKQSSIKRLAELTAAGFAPSQSSYEADKAAMADKRRERARLQR